MGWIVCVCVFGDEREREREMGRLTHDTTAPMFTAYLDESVCLFRVEEVMMLPRTTTTTTIRLQLQLRFRCAAMRCGMIGSLK